MIHRDEHTRTHTHTNTYTHLHTHTHTVIILEVECSDDSGGNIWWCIKRHVVVHPLALHQPVLQVRHLRRQLRRTLAHTRILRRIPHPLTAAAVATAGCARLRG